MSVYPGPTIECHPGWVSGLLILVGAVLGQIAIMLFMLLHDIRRFFNKPHIGGDRGV